MQTRYHDIAEVMESKPGLPAACVASEKDDWKQCIFSQYAIKYMQTPTFLINSLCVPLIKSSPPLPSMKILQRRRRRLLLRLLLLV